MKGIETQKNISFLGCKSPTDILVMNSLVMLEDEEYKFSCGHPHQIWLLAGPISARFIREEDVVRKVDGIWSSQQGKIESV